MSHVVRGSRARADVPSIPPAHNDPTLSHAPVLITEHEVVFSTAAAVSLPPATTHRRRLSGALVAAVRRIMSPLPAPPQHYRHEPYYLEKARMSRAMGRL
jgi:hypothetical protein